MSYPENLKYTEDHEWVLGAEDTVATIGITEFAADALGDIVYVELPQVGASVTAGEPCGELESTKSVSDLVSPLTGEVTEINAAIDADPSLVNTDPYGEGWLFRCTVSDDGGLLTATEYTAHTKA